MGATTQLLLLIAVAVPIPCQSEVAPSPVVPTYPLRPKQANSIHDGKDETIPSRNPRRRRGWFHHGRTPSATSYILDHDELDEVATSQRSSCYGRSVGREWALLECNATDSAGHNRIRTRHDPMAATAAEAATTHSAFSSTSPGPNERFTPIMTRHSHLLDSVAAASSFGSSTGPTRQRHHHRSSKQRGSTRFFAPVQEWWSGHSGPYETLQRSFKHWPKIQCRMEPTTTLKLRKTFRPLKTIIKLSAQFNTQLGVWQFHSSWEDAIIGGKLTLAGKELQLTKSWQLSVGPVEDLVTRLRLRAAVDLQSWKAYVRVGFRTERLSPINVMEGFSLVKQIPLDGVHGNVKLEVKANFALPEPEIEYSTETHRSLVGMGDIEVSIEELNLLLDY
jgi:hypothetical protein